MNVFSLSFIILVVACKTSWNDRTDLKNVVDEEPSSLTRDRVLEVVDAVAKLNYIPTEYTAGNCHARALYTAIEFALEGIPTQAHFVVPKKGKVLKNSKGEKYNYHVVSSVNIAGEELFFETLNPSKKLLTMKEWLALMHVTRDDVYQISLPGFYYLGLSEFRSKSIVYTNPYASAFCGNALDCDAFIKSPTKSFRLPKEGRIETIEEMGKVELFFVRHACGDLLKSIHKSKLSTAERKKEESKLAKRTRILVN